MILVTDKLTEEQANGIFMEYAPTLGDALNMAFDKMGADAKINVIPEGPAVIPKMIIQ